MRRGKRIIVLAPILTAALVGNANLAIPYWVELEHKYVSASKFEIDIPPKGWRLKAPVEDELIFTRDGLSLQSLKIGCRAIEKEFPFTKKKLAKEMRVEQVAEVIIDDFSLNPMISDLHVTENGTADVGGRIGFKIIYSYQTKDKLKKEGIYYGALVDQWYYYIYFEAPARHYFPRDQSTFEKIKETFKITL